MNTDLALSGLASGFDWMTFVDQMTEIERAPEKRLENEKVSLREKNAAYASLLTELSTLKTRVDALKDEDLFDSRAVAVEDETILSASAAAGAPLGTYTFNIIQLASVSTQQGQTGISQPLHPDNDVSDLTLSDAPLATAITAGTLTINGQQITIDTSDTLQDVFDRINTATGGAVTATYDSTTDKITLSSSSEIVLGSATDTSNFFQVTGLFNNGSGTITSQFELGTVQLAAALDSANFATTVSDGGSGAGEFKINGVSISYNASTDTVADVIDRINASDAGVVATYDPINDQFVLTNQTAGDLGIALEDVTGNFLQASGLLNGTLNRGNNLIYTINGGGQRVSTSNVITEATSGITGLTITALDTGSTTVTVSTDTEKIKTAINDFIEQYNKAQSMIQSQTATVINSEGKPEPAVLAGDLEATRLATELRKLANNVVSGLSGTIQMLAALGISTNGTDDTISLTDSDALDTALKENLDEVKSLFTDSTDGVAVRLSDYLDSVTGDDGLIESKQETYNKQIADLDVQIQDLERLVQSNREALIESFIAMERAQAQINQQLQFLSQRLGITA